MSQQQRGVPQRPTPNRPAAAQPNGSQSEEPGVRPAPPTSQREAPTSGDLAGPRSPTTPRAISVMMESPPDPSGPSRVEALPANVDEHTDTFDVELTLGCGSIVAEGAPNASDVAMEIEGPGLDRVTHDDARGRTETFELCPLRMGHFTVRVRSQSPAHADAMQARLFLVHDDGRRVEVLARR